MQNGQSPVVQTSSEQIWQLVQQEGKSARNLVAWSVPAIEHSRTKTRQSPAPEGTQQSRERGTEHSRTKTRQSPAPEAGTKLPLISRKPYQRGSTPGYSPTRVSHSCGSISKLQNLFFFQRPLSKRDAILNEELCVAVAGQYSQIQRGNKPAGKKADLRARYWCYLFDNLHRAVDEIYCTCEVDESILECQVYYGWPFVSKFEMHNSYLRCIKFIRDWCYSFEIGIFIRDWRFHGFGFAPRPDHTQDRPCIEYTRLPRAESLETPDCD